MPYHISNNKTCRLETYASFSKGETILTVTERPSRIGVLTEGEAHLTITDEFGQENVYETLGSGDSFGAYYLTMLHSQVCYVIADTNCRVMFLDMTKVLTGCPQLCDHHQEMMKKLIMQSVHHSQVQSMRINILSQRSLRDKLLTYLRHQEQYYSPGEEFLIPMNLVNLASFLSVDRSAMMREIRRMNDEGIIRSSGRNFTLL